MERYDVRRREQEFHDALVAEGQAASEPPAPPDLLELDLLERAGSLQGTRVLEIGCGAGNLTLELLARNAAVTALDISPRMVETARARVQRFSNNRHAEWLVAPAEETGLPDASFDLIVGKWILHHADIPQLADEVQRLLRPGGRAIFIENSGTNPFLAFARRFAAGRWGIPRYGTEDEHPLVDVDYDQLGVRFGGVALHYPDFCFFQLFDRQILRFRWPRVTRAVRALDDWIWRTIPALRRYSFHVVIELTR